MGNKTAVEWLLNKISKSFLINNGILKEEEIHQALELEKQQIMDAFYEGSESWDQTSEEYYSETYKKPESEPDLFDAPIDFGVAGRILKSNTGNIVVTTGYIDMDGWFSCYIIEHHRYPKGRACNLDINHKWADITDTYELKI